MPSFNAWIDLPFAMVFYAAAVGVFFAWLNKAEIEGVKDPPRLKSMAAARIAVLIAALLFASFLADVAMWAVTTALVMIPTLLLLPGGFIGFLGSPFVLAALLTREFVLGFPGLVLRPKPTRPRPVRPREDSSLVGRTGIARSPLRPSGDAIFDDQLMPAVSDDGTFIDAGRQIVVCSASSRTLRVRMYERL